MRTARHRQSLSFRRPRRFHPLTTGATLLVSALVWQVGCLDTPEESDALSDATAQDVEALEVTTDMGVVQERALETNDYDRADRDQKDVDPAADAAAPQATPVLITKLAVNNYTGTARNAEPVRVGIPIAKSANITDPAEITLYNQNNVAIPVQVTPLARWSGSPTASSSPLRWVLLSFQATAPANTRLEYTLYRYGTNPNPASAITASDSGSVITVNTGAATFSMNRGIADLFSSVQVGGTNLIKTGNGIQLKDSAGKIYRADLSKATTAIESQGRNEAVVKITGQHVQSGTTTTLLNYTMRLTFTAGHSDIRISYTIHNPTAAIHTNNIWVLGDSGSRYIEDVSLVLPLNTSSTPSYLLSAGASPFTGSASQEIKIYQDSSGGNNYKAATHYNKNHVVPISFRGYKVTAGSSTLGTGNRVQPWLDVSTSIGGISVGVRQFWQNFPKALAYSGGVVRVGLFPTEYGDTFEIQGAEQKTHEMTVYFHPGAGSASAIGPVLSGMLEPIQVSPSTASYYFSTGAMTYDDSTRQGQKGADGSLEATMDTTLYPRGSDTRTYTSQWEQSDEFGWRNYGDMIADHEEPCTADQNPYSTAPITHYNNQYDYVQGLLHLYARTLDRGLLEVGMVAARHTADIDVNHTTKDYAAYNGGMFWHTTHDVWADTSSHRSYPATSVSSPCTPYTAGGPGLGHLWMDGLSLHYWMTGDLVVRDTIVELGNYAITRYTKYGDETDGRSMGNLMRSLVSVYRVTGDVNVYNAMISVLKGGVSKRVSASTGTEWMDSLVGVALGQFLEMKVGWGQSGDADFNTAQSLLNTLANKVYNASIPNDINQLRWADTLAFAYRHCGKNTNYLTKAKSLYSYQETYYWLRGTYPEAKELAIILNAGSLVRYYRSIGL